jgi:hypothetical protein
MSKERETGVGEQLRQVGISEDELTRLKAGERVTIGPADRLAVGDKGVGEVIEVNVASKEGILAEEGGVKARILEKDTPGGLDGTFTLEKVE